MIRHTLIMLAATVGLLASGCAKRPSPGGPGDDAGIASLTGAWRGKVQFTSGAFAAVKDLEFMYVFNVGGTMTESSNYDFASPPSPPAYGIWRKVGPGQYEAKYSCFLAKAPAGMEDLAKGGWPPGGYANLVERITMAEDGKSFRSTIKFDAFGQTGKPTESGSAGGALATRVSF